MVSGPASSKILRGRESGIWITLTLQKQDGSGSIRDIRYITGNTSVRLRVSGDGMKHRRSLAMTIYGLRIGHYYMSAFYRLHFQTYFWIDDEGNATIKIFSDSNLGEMVGDGVSGVADLLFWLFAIRRLDPEEL